MSFTIASVQIGAVVREGAAESNDLLDRPWTTGFYKYPVSGRVPLTRLGLQGDAVADTRHHGGLDKAVLCYADSHYDLWKSEFQEFTRSPQSFLPGSFGENLTVTEADESNICLGDTFRIGDCKVQVSQPRQPCWKISRRWRIKTLTQAVTQTGRTGWYLRVMQEGSLQAGQSAQLIQRPNPTWTIQRANDVMFGREVDRMSVIELMQLSCLAEAWKNEIA